MPSSITAMEKAPSDAKTHDEGDSMCTPKKDDSEKKHHRSRTHSPVTRELREQESEYAKVMRKVLLVSQGDPKMTALTKPGGMSLRRMIRKLCDKPPDVCKELMGGDE